MSPVADLIEVLLKSLTDRLALAGLFLSAIFLLLAKLLPNSSIGAWANEHLVLVYGIGLFSLCYLPTRHLLEVGNKYIENHGSEKKLQKQLQTLGSNEQVLLYNPIVAQNLAFQTGTMHYHIAKSLEKRGILSEIESTDGHHNFVIRQDAYDYLRAHPELVGIKQGS